MGPKEFQRLLDERDRAASAHDRERIDAEIRARWERPRAVLISDMDGFSRITREEGILHFLALIRRMQILCAPIIAAHEGRLIKAVADNLFACFDTGRAAIEAGIAMHDACAAACEGRSLNDTIALGIGIAYGPLLDLDGEDFYGDTVNIAAKLGEDIADGGDLLITIEAAQGFAPPPGWIVAPRHARISAVQFDYLALTRRS